MDARPGFVVQDTDTQRSNDETDSCKIYASHSLTTAPKLPLCNTSPYSPCSLEATHPDLFWYGIHGIESLFTVMGSDVTTVTRTHTTNFDQVTGIWSDGRIGTFRGIRSGAGGYGGIAFGEKKTSPVGQYDGYAPLVQQIATFFQTGKPPVTPKDTIAIYAFMEAADESKRQRFVPVQIAEG